MPRTVKKFIVVNAITGEIKIRSFNKGLLPVEIAYPLIVTLPERYQRVGDAIELTLPTPPFPSIDVTDEAAYG